MYFPKKCNFFCDRLSPSAVVFSTCVCQPRLKPWGLDLHWDFDQQLLGLISSCGGSSFPWAGWGLGGRGCSDWQSGLLSLSVISWDSEEGYEKRPRMESGFLKTHDCCFQSIVTKPSFARTCGFSTNVFRAFIGVSHFPVLTQKVHLGFENSADEIIAFLQIASASKQQQHPVLPSIWRVPEDFCWRALEFFESILVI